MRIKGVINDIKEGMLNILFPPRCAVCGDIVIKSGTICAECNQKLQRVLGAKCVKCGKELESDIIEKCYDCNKKQHYFNRGVAVFVYNEAIKKSIYKFKYKDKREYAKFYAKEIVALYIEEIERWGVEAFVPIPLHRSRLRTRGYNQACDISNELSVLVDVPCKKDILIRRKATVPQKELSNLQRKNNLQKAFAIRKYKLDGLKCVALIDDIYTTGSTMDQCARLLKEAGVEKVYFITLSIGAGI